MSAPETTSKGRPSLLSQPAPGAPDNSFRILASLEGRVSAQRPARPRRLSKPLAAAALTVAGLSAIGAWQWHRAPDHGHPVLAAAADPGAAAAIGASAAAAAPTVAQSAHAAASTPQPAVIVPDDSTAPANTDPLSRALANGAVPSANKPASAGSVASASNPSGASSAALASVGQPAVSKPAVSRTAREGAKRRPSEKLADARAGRHSKARAAQSDSDSDAEVLAPLVARTKPYDSQASRHAGSGAKGKTHALSLAARVKECEKSNFFEEQVCRWHVCSEHWGKDPACPSASSASQTR